MTATRRAAARACSNMALVKYWGKRDDALVLPFTGSLSMTLDALVTDTEVEFTGTPGPDELRLDGEPATEPERLRASRLLDLVRGRESGLGAARVVSRNSFPTAGGLASSASGFAALSAAASWAAGQDPSPQALSILARRASGSACRSVLGGFVEWVRGERHDGSDSVAKQVLPESAWDVAMAIAVVDTGRKEVGSRDAMRLSVQTSPYFEAWVRSAETDLAEARIAVHGRDVERLGQVAERSFLRMHSAAMTSEPPSIFWRPATLLLFDAVRSLRSRGVAAYATVDAGPHVAVLCEGSGAEQVRRELAGVPGVKQVRIARPGPGVQRT